MSCHRISTPNHLERANRFLGVPSSERDPHRTSLEARANPLTTARTRPISPLRGPAGPSAAESLKTGLCAVCGSFFAPFAIFGTIVVYQVKFGHASPPSFPRVLYRNDWVFLLRSPMHVKC